MWLHEAWDVQSCLFALKLVVQRKEWSRSLALCSAQVCGASRLRHRNRSWSWPLKSMLVYTSTFLKRPRSGFPRRLYSDLSCLSWLSKRHLLFELPEKINKKYCIRSVHVRTEPKDPYQNGSVRIRVPLHPYWKVYEGFRATYAPLQMTSISGPCVFQ